MKLLTQFFIFVLLCQSSYSQIFKYVSDKYFIKNSSNEIIEQAVASHLITFNYVLNIVTVKDNDNNILNYEITEVYTKDIGGILTVYINISSDVFKFVMINDKMIAFCNPDSKTIAFLDYHLLE